MANTCPANPMKISAGKAKRVLKSSKVFLYSYMNVDGSDDDLAMLIEGISETKAHPGKLVTKFFLC